MDAFVEGRELSDDLCRYSGENFLGSEEYKCWWSKVQQSSSFIIGKTLSFYDWEFVLKVLAREDVSRIEHLVLELPSQDREYPITEIETVWGPVYNVSSIRRECPLGNIFSVWGPVYNVSSIRRGCPLGNIFSNGRFSALKTLKILSSGPGPSVIFDGKGFDSLASALSRGQFPHLRTLSLPPCDASDILTALTGRGISQLMSISITHSSYGLHWWQVLTLEIKNGTLPEMTSLHLGNNILSHVNLVDLIACGKDWFSSLENLSLDGCCITSNQLCPLLNTVMTLRKVALKTLDLHNNQLDYRAVDTLVNLEAYIGLPHLRVLDLSNNRFAGSNALVSLIKAIQRGLLPSLQKLKWEGNPVDDKSAEAIVQTYFEDPALTTEVEIDWFMVSDISLKTKLKTYRDRNVRLAAMREELSQSQGNAEDLRNCLPLTYSDRNARLDAMQEEFNQSLPSAGPPAFENVNEDLGDFLPLTSAKVFFCGYQNVGKTRLRRTLLRDLGMQTKFVWETFPNIFKDARTRGIEVSKMEEKKSGKHNTSLVLWDLAGRAEYHVLHGTFLADLGFEGGKATTFVLVFKAVFETAVEDKLLYWLRFVASCSLPLVKRHVVIVLNCFYGKMCTETHQRLWMALIDNFAKMFKDVLDIRTHPFIIDVRKAASVKPFKAHLFDQAQTLLQDVRVPPACFQLQHELKSWSEVGNSRLLPILTWQAFEDAWNLKAESRHCSAKAMSIAASYLHEIGEIIYFKEKEAKIPRSKYRSILVPDPEWFCRKVVGELLLPKEMLDGGSSILVRDDGSISTILFQAFFQHLLVEGTQVDDIISMLELVGLCYRAGEDKIVIPALIHEDDYRSIHWEDTGLSAAMGRCLATEDRARNAIPMTLFRRLQVELAQHPNFGARGDSEYRVGKSFLSFKLGNLFVLVQFDVDQSDPTDDRIDILVKSMTGGNSIDVRSVQVKCICDIVQKVEDLCVACCPGLRYDIKVVEPSAAADRSDKMSARKFLSLRELKDLLIKGEEYLSWQLDGHQLELKSFLSEGELKEVVRIVERQYDECRRDTMTMGLLTQDSLQEIEANEEKGSRNLSSAGIESMSRGCEWDDRDGLTTKRFDQGMQKLEAVVRREGRYTREHIDNKSAELLSEFRHKHEALVKHIQEQQSFAIEEKEASVPRYIFLSKKQGQSQVWISLREALKSSFELHMLCEARFDDGFLHEVEGQEGIELRETKKWLLKLSPWLRRSLQVAVIVGKTVGNVYLPGVFSFLPGLSSKLLEGDVLAKAVDRAATMIVEEDEGVTQVRDGEETYGTAAEPINLKERLIAQEVVKDLISEMGGAEFARKTGLRKVLLRAKDESHVGRTQQQSQRSSVSWICDVCYRKYGVRATDISPTW